MNWKLWLGAGLVGGGILALIGDRGRQGWPLLGSPINRSATSGWAAPRTVGGEKGIHGSLDFSAKPGDPVFAVAPGVVVFAGRSSGETGNAVTISHDLGPGLLTRSIHLATIKVAQGSYVSAGDIIGTAGNTGVGGALHLHLDTHVKGDAGLKAYKDAFGWPSTSLRPLIKRQAGYHLVPAEPLIKVVGYSSSVREDAQRYGIQLAG